MARRKSAVLCGHKHDYLVADSFLVEYEGKGPTRDHSVETPHLLVFAAMKWLPFLGNDRQGLAGRRAMC
jgi:hypothetical protein